MTIAEPIVAAPGDEMVRFLARRESLISQGAEETAAWAWYVWQTVTAAWEAARRCLLIVAELETDGDDWLSALALAARAGWCTDFSDPGYEDFPPPGYDRVSHVWLWRLGHS